jgi:hypothetical protein
MIVALIHCEPRIATRDTTGLLSIDRVAANWPNFLPCSSGGMNVADFTRLEHRMLGIGPGMGEFPARMIFAQPRASPELGSRKRIARGGGRGGRLATGFLFLCLATDFQTGPSSFTWPDCPVYWTLDDSGTDCLSKDEATQLGFPSI